MEELIRTNDIVLISWLRAALGERGIIFFILDEHTSILEGSAGAIPQRILVDSDQLAVAKLILAEAER